MNPMIHLAAIDKIVGQIRLFNIGMATGLGENLKFKHVDQKRNGSCQVIPAQDTLHDQNTLWDQLWWSKQIEKRNIIYKKKKKKTWNWYSEINLPICNSILFLFSNKI